MKTELNFLRTRFPCISFNVFLSSVLCLYKLMIQYFKGLHLCNAIEEMCRLSQTDIEPITWSKKPQSFCTHIFVLSWIVVTSHVRHIKLLLPSLSKNDGTFWINLNWITRWSIIIWIDFCLFFPLIQPLFQHRRKAAILCFAETTNVRKGNIVYIIS